MKSLNMVILRPEYFALRISFFNSLVSYIAPGYMIYYFLNDELKLNIFIGNFLFSIISFLLYFPILAFLLILSTSILIRVFDIKMKYGSIIFLSIFWQILLNHLDNFVSLLNGSHIDAWHVGIIFDINLIIFRILTFWTGRSNMKHVLNETEAR